MGTLPSACKKKRLLERKARDGGGSSLGATDECGRRHTVQRISDDGAHVANKML